MLVEIQDIDSLFHITEPWYIESSVFNEVKQQLDVFVCIRKGALFCCSHCGEE
jgi:transposase